METLDAYQKICQSAQLPPMQQGAPKLESRETWTDPDHAWLALQNTQPTQGWLQFQSRQQYFTGGLPDREDDWGCLLAAEAVTDEGHSLTLRQYSGPGWILSTHSHDEKGDGLYDEIRHRLHGANGFLVYRRYWSDDAERGFIQKLCLLSAIEIHDDREE